MRAVKIIAFVLSLSIAVLGGYVLGTNGLGMGLLRTVSGQAAPAQRAASAAPAVASTPSVAVRVSKVERVALPLELAALGTLRSEESVVIRPETAGRIVSIAFQEGRRVERGAVLVYLDDSIQLADLEQARAGLALSQASYARATELRAEGFISHRTKEEAENALEVARSAVAQAQARLARTRVHAPFSGTLGLRSVSIGDYVKEGQEIVSLEAIDSMKVDFQLPEVYSPRVKVGQALRVTVDAVEGESFEGRVSAVSPLFDRNTRSVVVRASVVNRAGQLRSGMFARVSLPMAQAQDSLVIPESALIPESGGQYVSKVDNGRAVRVAVEIGRRHLGNVEVLHGLSDGDTVVTQGQFKLKEGSAVRSEVAPSPGAASNAR